MIGSRETPDYILTLMRKVATQLDKDGWTVRSGGANGSDSAAEVAKKKEIYLPWNGFNGHYRNPKTGYIVTSDLESYQDVDQYTSVHHQWWSTVKKKSVKDLHRRNMFQVLGQQLGRKSVFVICYAEPDEKRGVGHVKGGTGSAVSLALSEGVPVYNLYYEKMQRMMEKYLA
jgi:hypothetical protein